jgi:hypothetical protein
VVREMVYIFIAKFDLTTMMKETIYDELAGSYPLFGDYRYSSYRLIAGGSAK